MDVMNEKDALIMIAPYDDLTSARRDFEDLKRQVHKGGFELREAVLVTKDADGKPKVIETSGHHGTSGAGWGAGIGLLIGLVVPPMLAGTVAIGAAAGVLVAKFADHSLKSGLQHEVGQALTAGTGVVIAVFKPDSRAPVERVLAGAIQRSVLEFSGSSIASLEAAVAEAMNTANPQRPQPVVP